MRIKDFEPYLFNPSKDLHNFECFLEELKIGNCVALVGAGLSDAIRIPGWEKLIVKLSDFSNLGYSKATIKCHPDRWLDIAEEAKKYWEEKGQMDNYYDFLQNTLSPTHTKFNNTHLVLLETNFLSYLTTNFDDTLEKAAKRISDSSSPNNIQIYPNMDSTRLRFRKIFYLHGKIENRRIVFTRSEYKQAYEHGIIDEVLWQAYSNMSIVLVGFSLRDPYIRTLFKNLRKQLNERREKDEQLLGRKKNTRRHFVLVGTNPVKKTDEVDFTVDSKREEITTTDDVPFDELGFYPIRYKLLPNDNHLNLEEILERLPRYTKAVEL